RQVVEGRVEEDDEGAGGAYAPDGVSRIRGGRRVECAEQAHGRHPVGERLVPGARAELRRDQGGEAARTQVGGVRDAPPVPLLEVVREGDEVVAGIAVGGSDAV